MSKILDPNPPLVPPPDVDFRHIPVSPGSNTPPPKANSFAPWRNRAPIGVRPYHAAFARGVKLIGATSHYVTEVLDEGPIIEQDVTRISHRDDVGDLLSKGRDLERVALSRAVKWHLEHRILSYGSKTVVFD